jgi:plastocyanin
MNSKTLILLGIVILVIVLGGALLLNRSFKTSTTNTTTKTQTSTTTQGKTTNQVTTAVVNVTNSGFEPKDLKIKVGAQVVWTNKSGKTVTVNSDNHPTNLLWPFLNLGAFDNGQSVSTTFAKSGKYTYHNHFDPSQTGSVTVE